MGRSFTATQSLGTTRYQTSRVELTKILKCQFMQIIRFLLQYLWRCQNVISFFIFFLLFLYIHIFCFFLLSIAFSWFIRALPVYAWFKFTCCLPTPGQRPGQVQPFGPGGGGSCPGGRGLGQIKNYLLFDFAQYVSYEPQRLPQDYVFLRKNAGIFRRVVGEE